MKFIIDDQNSTLTLFVAILHAPTLFADFARRQNRLSVAFLPSLWGLSTGSAVGDAISIVGSGSLVAAVQQCDRKSVE